MTDYKYRVYDGATGTEFADVARITMAMVLVHALQESYPQVTIDEIVTEVDEPPLKVGDRVQGYSSTLGEDQVGILVAIDTADTKYTYQIQGEGYDGNVLWHMGATKL